MLLCSTGDKVVNDDSGSSRDFSANPYNMEVDSEYGIPKIMLQNSISLPRVNQKISVLASISEHTIKGKNLE